MLNFNAWLSLPSVPDATRACSVAHRHQSLPVSNSNRPAAYVTRAAFRVVILTGPKGASLSWLRAQRGSAWDSVYTSYTVDRMKSAALPYKWYVMALLFAAAGLNYADRTAIT